MLADDTANDHVTAVDDHPTEAKPLLPGPYHPIASIAAPNGG
ncbi:hypothetical protein [Stackebrandtia soli]